VGVETTLSLRGRFFCLGEVWWILLIKATFARGSTQGAARGTAAAHASAHVTRAASRRSLDCAFTT
jgi:hypothetical protein